MKTIGKIAALAMTVGLAFALTACGGSASSSAASSAAASASSASASAASSESAAASSAAASASASASASSAAAVDADLYTNEYFGLEFELPEGWTFVSVPGEASAGSAEATGATKPVMTASSADQKQTIVVAIEQNGPNAGKTAAELLEAETAKLTEAATGSNMSYTSETATITFAPSNKEMPASITTITQDGATVCTGMAVDEKDGNFLEIIITAPTEDEVTAIFKHFQVSLA